MLNIKVHSSMGNRSKIPQTRFRKLIRQAHGLLGISPQELKNEYAGLLQRVDSGTSGKAIEIRLNKENVTISCLIDKHVYCTDIYFFFDRKEDKDAFLGHLVNCVDYSFRKGEWLLADCSIKTEKIKDILAFHFYRNY